jgi:hypothetical protein
LVVEDGDLVPYSRWFLRVDELAHRFQHAEPFPHVVLDDFLLPEAAQRCLAEFPPLGAARWINYTHVNERKFGQSDRKQIGPANGAVIDEMNSPRFVGLLERLTGIQRLIPDVALMGSGLHQSGAGGYLNVHADFTGHPHHPRWRRRVNLLLYLNKDWPDSYGGHLELWDQTMRQPVRKVAPLFNRAVIFRTDSTSFHGHPDPMTCPTSVTRKSLALYYFTEEVTPFVVRSTDYRARPSDGAKRMWIYLDKMALRGYDKVKRRFGLSDDFASKLLGALSRR